jgi:hypothetical protein
MSYASPPAIRADLFISPWSLWSIGAEMVSGIAAAPATAVYSAANRAHFIPLYIPRTVVVHRMWVLNGTSVSGTIDMGIYSETGTKIVSKGGGDNQTGANAIQFLDITDTELARGTYYMAISMSNNVGHVLRIQPGIADLLKAYGIAIMDTAHALPATATLADPTSSYVPMFGIALRAAP